jgi:hypothetical protein
MKCLRKQTNLTVLTMNRSPSSMTLLQRTLSGVREAWLIDRSNPSSLLVLGNREGQQAGKVKTQLWGNLCTQSTMERLQVMNKKSNLATGVWKRKTIYSRVRFRTLMMSSTKNPQLKRMSKIWQKSGLELSMPKFLKTLQRRSKEKYVRTMKIRSDSLRRTNSVRKTKSSN